MEKLRKFRPVLGMCSQGQKRQGVHDGSMYLYNHIFKDLCEPRPYVIQHEQFDDAAGYLKLYQTCHSINKPLLLGGDHSVSSSSVMASLQKFRDLNVFWIDAHPDMHTFHSTQSGNKHGTPLSVCCALESEHWASRMSLRTLNFNKLTYCGIRDIDDFEEGVIERENIRVLGVADTIDHIRKCDGPVHISFDVDALDPSQVSSTGTRVPGGLYPDEVRDMIIAALDDNKLVSLDVVEFNTALGDPESSLESVKATFRLGEGDAPVANQRVQGTEFDVMRKGSLGML